MHSVSICVYIHTTRAKTWSTSLPAGRPGIDQAPSGAAVGGHGGSVIGLYGRPWRRADHLQGEAREQGIPIDRLRNARWRPLRPLLAAPRLLFANRTGDVVDCRRGSNNNGPGRPPGLRGTEGQRYWGLRDLTVRDWTVKNWRCFTRARDGTD